MDELLPLMSYHYTEDVLFYTQITLFIVLPLMCCLQMCPVRVPCSLGDSTLYLYCLFGYVEYNIKCKCPTSMSDILL